MDQDTDLPEAVIATDHPDPVVSPLAQMREMAALSGRKPGDIAREFARLSSGPGKLSFQDYVQLRLFDDPFIGGADKTAFVGRHTNLKLVREINYDHDWYAISLNKVAMGSYLGAHGLPAIQPQAIYLDGVSWPGSTLLCDPGALADFLRDRAAYPLFCKPAGGKQSLGSVVLTGLSRDRSALQVKDGRWVKLDEFAAFVSRTYPRGYLLQPCVRPAAELAALTEGALGTVRVVTVFEDGEARVLRACLKAPGGGNAADNYWRPGNRLVRLDPETGTFLAMTEGVGLGLREIDLDDAPGGLRRLAVPQWDLLKSVARAAQSVMRDLPLIGWDIAPAESGPVIVEMNPTPDAVLNQISDRRGFLEPSLLRLAAQRKAAFKAAAAETKAELRKFSAFKA
jgi:hypothetical protein